MSEDIILPSGSKLSITVAPFEDAIALQEVIGEAVGDVSLPENVSEMDASVLGIMSNPDFLSLTANKIKQVMLSKRVRAQVFKCFERVTYNDLRLTKAMFDDPAYSDSLIKDYYIICWEVIKANCLPFFAQIISKFKEQSAVIQLNQESQLK